MTSRHITGAMFALLVVSAPVYSQSLGDVARVEEARRGLAKKATRSYSNASLEPGEVTAPNGPPASCYMSLRTGKCVSGEELVANSEAHFVNAERAKQEPLFRREAANIRAEFSRLEQEIAQLEATAADETRTEQQRASATKMLGTRRELLAQVQKRWKRLEKNATEQRMPLEWLEPIPEFARSSQ